MSPEEFAQKIKSKYPQYRQVDDIELTQKILQKYPQYGKSVNLNQQTESSFLDKTQNTLGSIFGGEVIGEAIGTQIAKAKATPEERAFIEEGPGALQIAGDVARTGLTFAPISRISNLVGKAVQKLGLNRFTKTIGDIVAGGSTGAALDVAEDISEQREIGLGGGTIIGAGIPAASPVAKAISRASGKVGFEIQGALTGTSAETIEEAFNAARRGGKDADALVDALRGKTTPEKLVQDLNENIAKIEINRNNLFRETLNELSDEIVETQPAKNIFKKNLQEANITIDDAGQLNFANSKLKLVPSAQGKLQTAWSEINSLPTQVPLSQLDTTRQAVKAVAKISGDEPSANLANKLIEDASRSIRTAGESVEGYGKMLDNFAQDSEFLEQIQKGLSSGDTKTIDQTYRRMVTSLKTNNEQRKALVEELDKITDGSILSQVAGQQLSEVMPRGIIRAFAASLAGAGVATGNVAFSSFIVPLVLASPRVTGEFINALGIGAQKADILINTLNSIRGTLLKAGIIAGAEVNSPEED